MGFLQPHLMPNVLDMLLIQIVWPHILPASHMCEVWGRQTLAVHLAIGQGWQVGHGDDELWDHVICMQIGVQPQCLTPERIQVTL